MSERRTYFCVINGGVAVDDITRRFDAAEIMTDDDIEFLLGYIGYLEDNLSIAYETDSYGRR